MGGYIFKITDSHASFLASVGLPLWITVLLENYKGKYRLWRRINIGAHSVVVWIDGHTQTIDGSVPNRAHSPNSRSNLELLIDGVDYRAAEISHGGAAKTDLAGMAGEAWSDGHGAVSSAVSNSHAAEITGLLAFGNNGSVEGIGTEAVLPPGDTAENDGFMHILEGELTWRPRPHIGQKHRRRGPQGGWRCT